MLKRQCRRKRALLLIWCACLTGFCGMCSFLQHQTPVMCPVPLASSFCNAHRPAAPRRPSVSPASPWTVLQQSASSGTSAYEQLSPAAYKSDFQQVLPVQHHSDISQSVSHSCAIPIRGWAPALQWSGDSSLGDLSPAGVAVPYMCFFCILQSYLYSLLSNPLLI